VYGLYPLNQSPQVRKYSCPMVALLIGEGESPQNETPKSA
jgi:hypothetical protein